MTTETIHVIIRGYVQGVCYRAWTKTQADSLRLEGWVRNRTDGSVEAVFSGSAENIKLMIQRCADGPPNAKVDKVEVIQRNNGAAANGFTIRETC